MLYSRKQEGSEDKRVLKIDGALAPKVLRFDSPFRAEGCGGGSAAVIKIQRPAGVIINAMDISYVHLPLFLKYLPNF